MKATVVRLLIFTGSFLLCLNPLFPLERVLSDPFQAFPEGIVIGCDKDYPPLSYLKEENPTGLDVDIIETLKARSGRFIEIRLDDWSKVVEDLKQDRIDAISGILRTRERSDWFDFSIPYLTENYTIFSRLGAGLKGTEDILDKKAAILKGDAAISAFLIPHGLEDNLIQTESFSSALKLVAERKADYTIAPYSLGQNLIRDLDIDSRIISGRALFQVEYRMAVRKGNTELLFFLNESIASLQKSGELQKLIRKQRFYTHFSNSTVPPSSPFLAWLVMVLVVLFSGISLWRMTIKNRVEVRTRKLEHQSTDLQKLLEAIPYPLYWRDKHFRILGCNHLMHDIPGAEDLPEFYRNKSAPENGKNLPSVLRQAEESDLRTWETGRPRSLRMELPIPGEPKREFLHQSIPVHDSSGDLSGLLGLFIDNSKEEHLKKTVETLSTRLVETEEQLQKTLVLDSQSALFNSWYLRRQLEEEAAHYGRYSRSFSIILTECTEPAVRKNLEDGLLMEIGEALKSVLRTVDHVGRMDGTRFLVVLPQTGKEDGLKVMEKIRHTLEPIQPVRCAVTEYHGQGIESLIARAEDQLANQASGHVSPVSTGIRR